jgi:hypothetical protein
MNSNKSSEPVERKNSGGFIMEWAPFRVRADVPNDQVLAASAKLQRDFLGAQPGFVRRDLLKTHDGQWIDLVVWRDQASADKAVQAAMRSAVCTEYFQIMDADEQHNAGSGITHFRLMQSHGT